MSEQQSVAVVGSGYWGKNLVRNFHALGALRVVCDRSQAALDAISDMYPEVELCSDFEQVLTRSDIQGVAIATPAALHGDMVEQALESVGDWTLNGESIQRTFAHDDFKGSMEFVRAVADLAEAAQHHPDILIRWNKVTLTLSTHDAGGLTERDFMLAKSIDQLG